MIAASGCCRQILGISLGIDGRCGGVDTRIFVRCQDCEEIVEDGLLKDRGPCPRCKRQEYWDEIPIELWESWTVEAEEK